ncbi:MAG TPA: thiamine-phosphate kinase, partial [Bacteroidales bacterium]|nr:thiamine-phosphate kinase [Bacteroidales bacterium]
QSGVGCRLYEDKLPIDYQAAVLAEQMNLNIVTCALNGGEDYELLFTCPIADYDKLLPLDKIFIIGHITDKADGMNFVTREGQLMELQAQGWKAF